MSCRSLQPRPWYVLPSPAPARLGFRCAPQALTCTPLPQVPGTKEHANALKDLHHVFHRMV